MSGKRPLVSVIIATYNRASYLAQAIDSVLGQTLQDFEVLVVDDGSTDDTPDIVSSVKDNRIHYIYQENAGRSSARNKGLDRARGEFVALLDDDDLYLPHKLACQVAFLKAHPDVDLVGAEAQIIDDDGNLLSASHVRGRQPDLTLAACIYGCPLPTCTVLFRRRVLESLVQWFDPAMELAEDTDFLLRVLCTGCRMSWMSDVVSAYRLHARSSQGDGVRYSRAYERLLGKLFARADLPERILAEKDRLYAHYLVAGACRSYAGGQVGVAQSDLAKALTLWPRMVEGPSPEIAMLISGFAHSYLVRCPRAYIDYVFEHAPVWLKRHHSQTLGLFYMKQVFDAHETRARPMLRDWLLGVCYMPLWLLNRGVWSILVRDILRV